MYGRTTVRKDRTRELLEALKRLQKADVLVGIPESAGVHEDAQIPTAELAYIHTHGIRRKSMRKEMQPLIEQSGKYSLAYQMYIQAHGSPLWQAPPRPIIEPAIEHPENKAMIANEMAKALELIADGETTKAERQLQRVGQVASSAVRDWFEHPDNGWAPNAPYTIKEKGSDRPLVDTGNLRKAITYVIREKG